MKKIAFLLEKLGITPKEVVISWISEGLIDLKDIQVTLEKMRNTPVFATAYTDIKPGMFLHRDGRVSSTYIPNQCLAMVLDVDTENAETLMLALQTANLPFFSQEFFVDTFDLKNGLNATHFVKQLAEASGFTAEAAKYCLEYTNAFVESEKAFLMTDYEIKRLEPNLSMIFPAIKSAGLANGGFWLSSTVDDETSPSAQLGIFTSERILIRREHVTVPLTVYPTFKLGLSRLNLTK